MLLATNSLARKAASPGTGFLSDRFGRRPLVIIRITLWAASAILAHFSTSYEQFLILGLAQPSLTAALAFEADCTVVGR